MEDKFKDECGVFGIWDHEEASRLAYLGLFAQQHRGQESAGIVTLKNGEHLNHKGLGLVGDVFSDQELLRLDGRTAIGHVRYSTTGQNLLTNAQPLVAVLSNGPVALALTRQNLAVLPHAAGWAKREALRGGYVLQEATAAKVTLIATGAEVSLAVDTAALLGKEGIAVRVVSMPCVELFLQQDAAWQKSVLGTGAVFALEMGRPELWCQFTGRLDRCIGQTTFGASAPAKAVAEHFGFSAPKVAARIKAAL